MKTGRRDSEIMVIFHGAEVHLKMENIYLLMGDGSITKMKMPSIL